MSPDITERAFEEAIEAALLRHGPDATRGGGTTVRESPPAYGDDPLPGGYRKRRPEDYDRGLCLIPADVVDFLLATQPQEWEKLKPHHGADIKPRFLGRLSREIARRGALDVLRNGVEDSGCKFRLAYFRPASGLNEELQRLHAANLFAVVRQLRFSEKDEQSLDLALFLNGIPLFTVELKNPLNGQDVQDAIRQYRTDRDPREPLFAYGRCLAHVAVDPEQVFVTTALAGPKTRFLPFNQERFGGAGNPPVPPTRTGFPTDYLWERIWARDSVLDLVRQFIHEVEAEDDRGRKTGKRFLIFPRYQQLDCVRRLVGHARDHGTGRRYLVQHSAGSGKSFTIGWLAHRLSVLHDAGDRRVFDSVVVVTDRRVLDRQLQSTIRQFEQTLGVVENIEHTSRQLQEALEAGRTIIVTTLQKFPVIAAQIGQLPGKRFAVIVDEAHSSQSGESTKSLKAVLAAGSLEEAEREEAGAETPEEEIEERVLEEIRSRGRLPNLSTFAFTATPKPKTLELFGSRRPDGKFKPFHRYTMRQAIEEGFILDVLGRYSTDMESFRIQQTSRGRIKLERHGGPLEPAGSKPRDSGAVEELEALSRIIAALNERFGLNLGPEHRVTLEQIRAALDQDAGLDASARVNTRENVRLTFDPKVEDKIQEIVQTNFDLYKRITDDPDFGRALKNFLFDDYIRRHRRAEELLKLQESKTLEFKSSLRWNLRDDRKDDKHVTHAALRTIAAFLNTEGGDLLIGVDDDRTVLGIEHDRLESDDRFMRHLAQAVRNGLGDRAGTCIDPKTQIVDGKTVCLVSCQRSPEPVYLRWKGVEKADGGDLYVRTGPGSMRLDGKDAQKYVATRFGST